MVDISEGSDKIILWALCVITPEVFTHLVTESSEETRDTRDTWDTPDNITTLYPVPHQTIPTGDTPNTTTIKPVNNDHDSDKQKTEATVWKLETAFGHSKIEEKEDDNNGTDSREQVVVEKPENKTKEFKPSQHLGDFFEFDGQVPPTNVPPRFLNFLKNTPVDFHSSPKFPQKHPNDIKYEHFPYKFESPTQTKARSPWLPMGGTLESPKQPAGGLYKSPDPFTDKPPLEDDEGDFGLDSSRIVKNAIQKHSRNPWKQLLHVMTAFIPVGLIISALTPQLITIESTEPHSPYSDRFARRSDMASPPPNEWPPRISERCRRRLLCELFEHYVKSPRDRSGLGKACTHIRCANTVALVPMLSWLLDSRLHPGRGGPPLDLTPLRIVAESQESSDNTDQLYD